MTKPTRYLPAEDVLSTDYETEGILVHLETKRCFRLNDTAATIYRAVRDGLSRDEIVASMRESYDVDEETAVREVDRLLDELVELRVIRPDVDSEA